MIKTERLERRKTMKELSGCMEEMIHEANDLRDEAAVKMYDVPKRYKLNDKWDDVRFGLTILVALIAAVGFMLLLCWSMENDHMVISVFCLVAFGIGMVRSSVAKNRPFKVEEEVKDYYVNELYYGALAKELARLKTGIADYNRQYEEQKDYISKFKNYMDEVEDYGGKMSLILKANDFRAQLQIKTSGDEVDCGLKFNESGYRQLKEIVGFFAQKVEFCQTKERP